MNSFCHVANGVLQAAAAADMHQRKRTEVVNLPADEQPPVLLPFVPRCWLTFGQRLLCPSLEGTFSNEKLWEDWEEGRNKKHFVPE